MTDLRGLRWYVCGLLFAVTCLNYLDRVSLSALKADVLVPVFGWTEADFAWTVFALQTAFAVGFVAAGRLLDRVGVRLGLALGAALWSLAALGHTLASTVLGFAIARFVLGLGEATNFPAAIKAIAEWFPRRERALATGIFNIGTNVGGMLQGPILFLALFLGGDGPPVWQAPFVLFGLLGFVWLAFWLRLYRPPEEHPRLSPEEAALIRADQEPPVATVRIPWPSLLRYRQAWAFSIGKMLTDPVWWFFLFWIPTYLRQELADKGQVAWALVLIYLCADVGSILGGWIPGRLQRAGWPPSRARFTTMLVFGALMPATILLNAEPGLGLTVALLSLVTGAHQGWSANMFTVASDAFPRRAVGSVVGFGAMCGAVGGMVMPLVAGSLLELRGGDYALLFLLCGILHPLSWITIRLLTGRTIQPVDIDRGLRTAFSPALLAAGLLVAAAGAGGALWIWRNWAEVIASAQRAQGTPAMVLTGSVIVGLVGLALVHASREQA